MANGTLFQEFLANFKRSERHWYFGAAGLPFVFTLALAILLLHLLRWRPSRVTKYVYQIRLLCGSISYPGESAQARMGGGNNVLVGTPLIFPPLRVSVPSLQFGLFHSVLLVLSMCALGVSCGQSRSPPPRPLPARLVRCAAVLHYFMKYRKNGVRSIAPLVCGPLLPIWFALRRYPAVPACLPTLFH